MATDQPQGELIAFFGDAFQLPQHDHSGREPVVVFGGRSHVDHHRGRIAQAAHELGSGDRLEPAAIADVGADKILEAGEALRPIGTGTDTELPATEFRDLRALFRTLTLSRGNAGECCEIDNNPWTLWDGFQTLPNRSKCLLSRGYETTSNDDRGRNRRPMQVLLARATCSTRKRDSFKTHPDEMSSAA
jgi:hypothetical protein